MSRDQEQPGWWEGAWELPPGELASLYVRQAGKLRIQENAEEFLLKLTQGGVESVRKEFTDGKVSKKDTRMLILDSLKELLDDAFKRKDRIGIMAYAAQVKKFQKPGPATHAAEILEAIANGVVKAGQKVAEAARSAKNAGLAVAIAVKDFFRDTAGKVAGLAVDGAAAIGRGFNRIAAKMERVIGALDKSIANRTSKIVGGIDSGAVSIANALTEAGLRAGNAADRATTAVRRAAVHASYLPQDVRHRLSQAIAPKGSTVTPPDSDKGKRLQDIDEARDKSKTARERGADVTTTYRQEGLRLRGIKRENFRTDRSSRTAEASRKSALSRDHRAYDDFTIPSTGTLSPGSTPVNPRQTSQQGRRQT